MSLLLLCCACCIRDYTDISIAVATPKGLVVPEMQHRQLYDAAAAAASAAVHARATRDYTDISIAVATLSVPSSNTATLNMLLLLLLLVCLCVHLQGLH
jgi:hypothetical protein